MSIKSKVKTIKDIYSKFYKHICLINKYGKAPIYLQIRYGLGVVYNFIRYRATISDYFELCFYKKNEREKEKYFTSKMGLRFAEKVDSLELIHKYNSKTTMYDNLKKYTKRDLISTIDLSYEDFEKFVNKHPRFLYKPDVSDCGKGIEVWNIDEVDMKTLWKKAIELPAILDSFVKQHPVLEEVNPTSVNTIRVFTVKIGSKCHFIGAAFRMGATDAVIDNYSAGGLVGSINLKTGIVIDDAEDYAGKRYEYHPISHTKMKGFQIPNWNKVIEFTKHCANDYELRYVAWDIAVREEDCVLIEANPNGMANLIQIAGAKGKKQQFDRLLKEYLKTQQNK